MTQPLCQRDHGGALCGAGPDGGPAPAVEQIDGRWYCKRHLGAAKAVASKRRDRGFGTCLLPQCDRPAVEMDGKCSEHRAGERAADGSAVMIEEGSGRGEHPYAPKHTEIYLVAFPDLGLLKVGKATPWTVRSRVRDAADKLWERQTKTGVASSVAAQSLAWAVPLFAGESVLWAISERVEHAAAGRLAHNVGASSVDHTEGKEWLRHEALGEVNWQVEFHRAVRETLAFLGHSQAQAGEPRPIL